MRLWEDAYGQYLPVHRMLGSANAVATTVDALKAINLDNCKFVTHGSLFAKASALAELDQEARSGANLTRSSEPASWIA